MVVCLICILIIWVTFCLKKTASTDGLLLYWFFYVGCLVDFLSISREHGDQVPKMGSNRAPGDEAEL